MRPEGWENPCPYNPEPTPKLPNTAYNAYEAGADAMLKGLKRDTSESQYWDAGRQVGWVVYIPEE